MGIVRFSLIILWSKIVVGIVRNHAKSQEIAALTWNDFFLSLKRLEIVSFYGVWKSIFRSHFIVFLFKMQRKRWNIGKLADGRLKVIIHRHRMWHCGLLRELIGEPKDLFNIHKKYIMIQIIMIVSIHIIARDQYRVP